MPIKKNLLTRILIIALVINGVVAALLAYRDYLQRTTLMETRITTPTGIEKLEKIELGGIEQWILVRGWDKSSPVLLHLHGGPGSADISVSRHFDTELIKRFVVVHWDQRGGGKSYNRHVPRESMNREQFISDIRELTDMLRQRFNAPKIYLVGHSWGSEIGLLAASRYPDRYHAFVGIGQVVEYDEAEEISYKFVLDEATKAGNEKALQELRRIAPPYKNRDELLIQRKWLDYFGGQSHSGQKFQDLFKIALRSPDYSLLDGLKFFRGEEFSTSLLWHEGKQTDLFQQVPRIEVPAYFFVGRYDYNTPTALVGRYYEQLEAPQGKHLIWFENCSHMIPYECPQEYADVLVNRVLKETSATETSS